MSLSFELVVYICAIGFVSAALIGSLLVILTQAVHLSFPKKTTSQWIVALPLIAFIGPYWVARETVIGINLKTISWFLASTGAVISLVWSFCAGIFVVQFLHLVNVV